MTITAEQFAEQELSRYEEKLVYLEAMKEKVRVAKDELEASYIGIVNVKASFERVKKENIEELRRYKLAVAQEAKEIGTAFAHIAAMQSKLSQKDLEALHQTLSSLSTLAQSGVFAKLSGLAP